MFQGMTATLTTIIEHLSIYLDFFQQGVAALGKNRFVRRAAVEQVGAVRNDLMRRKLQRKIKSIKRQQT